MTVFRPLLLLIVWIFAIIQPALVRASIPARNELPKTIFRKSLLFEKCPGTKAGPYVAAKSHTAQEDAFGALLSINGTTPNSYLYCGESYDADLGLYYLRARLMNPLTGRFHTADSYEGTQRDAQTLHKYLYAGGNSVNQIDPSGFAFEPGSGTLGTAAHQQFTVWAIGASGSGVYYNVPLAGIVPCNNVEDGRLQPDVVYKGPAAGRAGNSFFELKPISHSNDMDLHRNDTDQISDYGRVLIPHQIYPGTSRALVPMKTDAGIFYHGNQKYKLILYPANEITFIKGQKAYTQGLIYYRTQKLLDDDDDGERRFDPFWLNVRVREDERDRNRAAEAIGRAAPAIAKATVFGVTMGMTVYIMAQTVKMSSAAMMRY